MRQTVFGFLLLAQALSAAALYRFLDGAAVITFSSIKTYQSDPTTAGAFVFGGIFLALFALAMILVFVAGALFISAAAGFTGGMLLCKKGGAISGKEIAVLLILSVALNTIMLLAGAHFFAEYWYRPKLQEAVSLFVMAGLMAVNATLNMGVAIAALKLTMKRSVHTTAPGD
ncbi:hypothetical protein JXA32_01095 [Candidatus Sumerlaeota bacterium]|nr:hypothetical protein [Candidatus Sumerlaeota bacterium]